jgi:hypothetical protein
LLARLGAAGGVAAGSLVGSGGLGEAMVELRARELLRLECTGSDGVSVFGAIEQHWTDGD